MTTPLRLVLDTNVVMSALLWGGTPGQLIKLAAEGEVCLFSSNELIRELAASLGKKRLEKQIIATGTACGDHVSNYLALAELVAPVLLNSPVSRDPDDGRVIACAIGAGADAVVSGDEDLLVLGAFEGMAILSVREAVDLIAAVAGK